MTKDDQEYLSKFKLSCDYKKKTKRGNRHDIAPFNYLMIETVCIRLYMGTAACINIFFATVWLQP